MKLLPAEGRISGHLYTSFIKKQLAPRRDARHGVAASRLQGQWWIITGLQAMRRQGFTAQADNRPAFELSMDFKSFVGVHGNRMCHLLQ